MSPSARSWKAKAEFEKVIARTGHLDVQAQLAELA